MLTRKEKTVLYKFLHYISLTAEEQLILSNIDEDDFEEFQESYEDMYYDASTGIYDDEE